MASNEERWIKDIVDDFIHSSVWLSPIQTFVDANCACFDYDDDDPLSRSSLEEQKSIYKQYQLVADALINGLCVDLQLDKDRVRDFCQRTILPAIDESYELLYAVNDFYLFTEVMKRKNLILQLQALVNIQLGCGLLKQTDVSDDQVLQLLLKATTSASPRQDLTNDWTTFQSGPVQNHTVTSNIDWRTEDPLDDDKPSVTPKSIDSVPEEILLDKLKELSIHSVPADGDATASAISSREIFLKQQRDLIIQQQRHQRAQKLERESLQVRPQSAANVARNVIETTNNQQQQISDEELQKRRVMAAKLRREVVDKR